MTGGKLSQKPALKRSDIYDANQTGIRHSVNAMTVIHRRFSFTRSLAFEFDEFLLSLITASPHTILYSFQFDSRSNEI